MIPLFKLLALKQDLDLAVTLAAEGEGASGYALLDHALHLQEQQEWTPWREDLLNQHRAALATFAREHGIDFSGPSEAPPLTPSEWTACRSRLRDRQRARWERSRRLRYAACHEFQFGKQSELTGHPITGH